MATSNYTKQETDIKIYNATEANRISIENLELGETAKYFPTRADATAYWEAQNTAGNTPSETFKIELGVEKEYHVFDASVTPERTTKVGDVIQKTDDVTKEGSKVVTQKGISLFNNKVSKNIIKDIFFEDIQITGTGYNKWIEKVTGNVYNTPDSDGFISVSTRGSDQVLSYDITNKLPKGDEIIYVSAKFKLEQSFTFTKKPDIRLVAFYNSSFESLPKVELLEDTIGSYVLTTSFKLSDLPDTPSFINSLRFDIRLSQVNVKVGDVLIINSRDLKYLDDKIIGEINKTFTPAMVAKVNNLPTNTSAELLTLEKGVNNSSEQDFNLLKDIVFNNIATSGNDIWLELVGGNTFNVVENVLFLTSRGSDQNMTYTVTKNLPKIGETIYLSAEFIRTEDYDDTNHTRIGAYVITDNGNFSTNFLLEETTTGIHNVLGKVELFGNAIIDGATEITAIRFDIRLGDGNSKLGVRNPRLLKSSNFEFLETISKEEREKLGNLVITNLITNIATNTSSKYSTTGLTKSTISDGIKFYTESGTGWKYLNHTIDTPWKPNHQYYIAYKVRVNTYTAGIDGNFFPTIRAKYDTPNTIGEAEELSSVLQGETGVLKALLTTNETNSFPTANILFVQFANFSEGEIADIDFLDVLVTDLGEVGSEDLISYNEMDALFEKYGFVQNLPVIDMPVKGVSSSSNDGDTPITLADVQGFGDSIMAQNWLALIPNRNTSIYGYGGQKSYYIRDKFFDGWGNRDRTQIFCIGRNNFRETTYIIDDLRKMVAELTHDRYLILTPPNGGYEGELLSERNVTPASGYPAGYNYFLTIEERLKNIYQDRYFNQRKAMIEGYDFGGVKLLSSFTQPVLNGTVQIEVGVAHEGTAYETDGTAFLNTQNANDTGKWSNEADKIIIGDLYTYDVYEIVSVDSATLMTVRLIENNTDFAPTDTVDNPIDSTSGSTSIIYLNICQKMDVFMWENDTTQSTLRSDGVHLSNIGKYLCGLLTGRKLTALGI